MILKNCINTKNKNKKDFFQHTFQMNESFFCYMHRENSVQYMHCDNYSL